MNHRTHPRIGAAILIAVILTGCTATANDSSTLPTTTPATTGTTSTATTLQEPSATSAPTPEPTPTPSLSRVDQVFAEAVQAAKDYTAQATKIENAGGEDWEALKPWWGNEQMLAGGTAYYRRFFENGISTIGYSTVRDATPTSVQLDADGPGIDRVELNFCLDSTHSERRDIDGNPLPVSGSTANITLLLRRVAPGNHWTIDWMETNPEPPC